MYTLWNVFVVNSAYPVDSHHVDELKGYSKTAIGMQKTLEESGVHINRNRPDLLWVSNRCSTLNYDLLGN